jgi:hypothetical protein
MKKILFYCAILSTSAVHAQITIDQNDLPAPGDQIIRHRANNFVGLDFTTTGPNSSWDFSTLTMNDSSVVDYFNISSAPFTALLTFGPLAPNNLKSQLFRNGGNPLNTGNIPGANLLFNVDSTFEYYKKSSTRFAKTGYSITLNSFPVPLPFDSNDVLFALPLNYNDVDSSHSVFEINTPFLSFIYYQGDQRRTNTVDGYGTLKLPNDTTLHQVLRIKSEVLAVDTIHIDTLILNNGFKFNRPKNVTYHWIAKGKKWPLLTASGIEIGGNLTINSVEYKHTYIPTPFHIDDLASENIQLNQGVQGFSIKGYQGPITVTNVMGATCFAQSIQENEWVSLAPGIYQVRVGSRSYKIVAR